MSTSSTPIFLLLGAGKNIGASLARHFGANGYKVATVSRQPSFNVGDLHVTADLSDYNSVPSIFARVKQELGTPSVVVYNASYFKPAPKDDPLSIPLSDVESSLDLQTKSLFAAAKEARTGFEQLPKTASRTFIYTGNALNTLIIPSFITLGVGKAASAHIIASAAEAYKAKGFKFYYADERTAEGSPVYNGVSGEGGAEYYFQLSENTDQGPWLSTFVSGSGYKDFGPYKL